MILESLTGELDGLKSEMAKRDVEMKRLNDQLLAKEASDSSGKIEIARLTKENGDLELRLKLAEQEKNNAASQGGEEMTKV
jgi:hypothetical protein